MAIITDPDLLAQGVEVTISTGAKTVALNIAGDLSTDGITLKCLYSFLKEEWKLDAALIKFPFPMTPITDEQFEFVNGWDLAADASRNLIRTAGWAVRNTSGVATAMYAGVISLGSLREVVSAPAQINVVAASKTFTRVTGSFLTDKFEVGQSVTFSGFTNSGNNVTKIIESVTATVITVTSLTGLVNETGSGDEVANASSQVYYIRGENETQSIDLGDIGVADTFTLGFGGLTTAAIAYSATTATLAANIKAGLEALSTIADGDITVVWRSAQLYEITFGGSLAATNVTPLTITNPTTFTPGSVVEVRAGTDQPTATPSNIVLLGRVNQAIQIYKDSDGDGLTTDAGDYDYRNFLRLFVREWGDSYATSSLPDIGVSTLTYQAYRFPLTTSADPKISQDLQSNAGLAPYDDINVTWHAGFGFQPASARAYVVNEVGQDVAGRWFRCSVAGTLDAAGVANYTAEGGTGTFVAFSGERQITGVGYFPFSVIVDADIGDNSVNPTAEVIYESIAYQLDLATDIDAGSGTRNGAVTSALLRFVGDALITSTGVWIDDYNTNDINRITFTDANGSSRNFPYTASLTLNFGANLVSDPDAIYKVFFTNDDAPGVNAGNDYGTSGAIVVNDASSVAMTGAVTGPVITHTFAYDANVQRGAGSAASNAPITVVAIGLNTGQFVSTTGTIERSTANAASLTAALERNYVNP